MNKEWVNKKNNEAKEEFKRRKQKINDFIENSPYMLNGKTYHRMKADFKNENWLGLKFAISFMWVDLLDENVILPEDVEGCKKSVKEILEDADYLYNNDFDMKWNGNAMPYDKYLDSDPVEFDGDIIITDPCYIMRAKHHGTTPIFKDDWKECKYGSNMEVLGISNYMTRDTLYGDWSCTTYDLNTKEPIGEFCADAGMVSVIALDEVLKYNPEFDYHKERNWTTTWIKNFKGTVQFIVKEEEYEHSSDFIRSDGTVVWRKGDKGVEYEVEVVGHGINKVTGEPIDFIGTQTGL